MKKIIIIIAAVVMGLSVLLYFELRSQRLEQARAVGGSAIIEGTPVDVTARIQGRIQRIAVHEGDRVKKGQTVVVLDCTQQKAALDQAQATIERADAALQSAQRSVTVAQKSVSPVAQQAHSAKAGVAAAEAQSLALKAQYQDAKQNAQRMTRLQKAGVVSSQQADEAKTRAASLEQQWLAAQKQLAAAKAQARAASAQTGASSSQVGVVQTQVDAAKAQIQQAKASREQAQQMVDECSLQAPRNAYVQTRNFEPGEVVMPGSPVLSLVDTSTVKATFYVSNADLGEAKPGRKVEVVADAYPKKTFQGHIDHVAEEAEFTPRNVQTRQDRQRLVYGVEIRVPNPKGLLRPGMPVQVTLPGTGKDQ